jgi:hypothetical protein
MIPPKRITTAVYKQRIIDAVRSTDLPLSVDNVRTRAGLSNWESTKALLLELLLEEKVAGCRTARGWIFWRAAAVPLQQLQRSSID